jgi:hypothetical protein
MRSIVTDQPIVIRCCRLYQRQLTKSAILLIVADPQPTGLATYPSPASRNGGLDYSRTRCGTHRCGDYVHLKCISTKTGAFLALDRDTLSTEPLTFFLLNFLETYRPCSCADIVPEVKRGAFVNCCKTSHEFISERIFLSSIPFRPPMRLAHGLIFAVFLAYYS